MIDQVTKEVGIYRGIKGHTPFKFQFTYSDNTLPESNIRKHQIKNPFLSVNGFIKGTGEAINLVWSSMVINLKKLIIMNSGNTNKGIQSKKIMNI